jgi:hypothetical protein
MYGMFCMYSKPISIMPHTHRAAASVPQSECVQLLSDMR